LGKEATKYENNQEVV